MQEYDYLMKLILIGDSGVGKSCLLNQFIEQKFEKSIEPTIGVEFGSKKLTTNNQKVRIQIWDTAGQETFLSITKSYFKGAIGAFLIFDITDKVSFSHITSWLEQINSNSSKNIVKFLVGNKSDLED